MLEGLLHCKLYQGEPEGAGVAWRVQPTPLLESGYSPLTLREAKVFWPPTTQAYSPVSLASSSWISSSHMTPWHRISYLGPI